MRMFHVFSNVNPDHAIPTFINLSARRWRPSNKRWSLSIRTMSETTPHLQVEGVSKERVQELLTNKYGDYANRLLWQNVNYV